MPRRLIEDLRYDKNPADSKDTNFRQPWRKFIVNTSNIALLTKNDVGTVHMNWFGAIGDFLVLPTEDTVRPRVSNSYRMSSKQHERRPSNIRGKETKTRNVQHGNPKKTNNTTTWMDASPKNFTDIIGDSIVKNAKGFKMT